jgi:glycosyltransferase involved in cell wall biosynthesis
MHEEMPEATETKLKLSVVLATYNRAETLSKVLDHLARQDLSPSTFEVIVVDDGSPDNTRQIVQKKKQTAPFELSYLHHSNQGPGYTQNRGIRAARAPIILLLADDIFLTPGALRSHLEVHLRHPAPEVAVLGKVLQSPELNQSVFLKKWDPFRFRDLQGLRELPAYRFGAANLSFKRDFMLRYGMFHEKMARAGAAALEDWEVGYRLKKHGMRLLYCVDALGYHYHLCTLDEASRRWYQRGLNYEDFRSRATDPELSVYLHVLSFRTLGDHIRVLWGSNSFRGMERSFIWHIIRHSARLLILNRLTACWIWRPMLNKAESNRVLATLMHRQIYRAFLYYQFLKGICDAKRIYGD